MADSDRGSNLQAAQGAVPHALAAAYDAVLRLKQVERESGRDVAQSTRALILSIIESDGKEHVNEAPAETLSLAAPTSHIADEPWPKPGLQRSQLRPRELAHRQLGARLKNDVLTTFLYCNEDAPFSITLGDIVAEFGRLGIHDKVDPLMTRISRLRQRGWLLPVGEPGDGGSTKAGEYRLTEQGRLAAKAAFRDRSRAKAA